MSNKYIEISKVKLSTKNKDSKTILDDVYFTSPFKILPPFYINDDFIKVIIMSSSAGTLEGDVQSFDIDLDNNTNMELTSQSFEKIYTMENGEAVREGEIKIGSNSLLVYNLQPTIPFKDSAYKSKININLKDKTSRIIFTDIINCGRIGYGEKFEYKYYKSSVNINCNEELIYFDNTIYIPSENKMDNYGMFEGYTHFANIFIANFINYNEVLDEIRCILDENNIDGAASLTQYNDVSVKMFGYSADKLIQISESINKKLCFYTR